MRSRIEDIMTPAPLTVRAGEDLCRVAELMWDRDIGAMPVVDDRGHLVGMITDRDVCMAAYTQGRLLSEISVLSAMAKKPVWVQRDDDVAVALERMREAQVRRLPVIDADWAVIGLISVNDLVREAKPADNAVGIDDDEVIDALKSIGHLRMHRELTARRG